MRGELTRFTIPNPKEREVYEVRPKPRPIQTPNVTDQREGLFSQNKMGSPTVACSNKQKFTLRVSANGQSPPSYKSKVVDYDRIIMEQGDQKKGGKLQAYEGENGQTKAILKWRLFGSPFEGEGSAGSENHVGGRNFFRGESSRSKSLMKGARWSRVMTCNSSKNIFDFNILNCNRLFWSRQDISSPITIWESSKELGVTYEGEQGDIIEELENMEARDRILRLGIRSHQGYQC